MATMKQYHNNQNNNLSQPLDIGFMSNKEQFETNFYYNSFYNSNNTDNNSNLINNGHCVNNHQINNSNIENNLNKKSKSTDNDYESKQSLIKILSQHQTENSGMLHSSQVDSEQISILKPLREFQILNHNNLMNETMVMNDQIYNNFHQQSNILQNFQNNNHNNNNNRHEFYTDNRGHNLIDQSLKSNLGEHHQQQQQQKSINPSSQQPYSDYVFKYEKTEDNIIQTNSNTQNSFSDDEDEDDEFDEDEFEENDSSNSGQHNYDYECEEPYSLNNNKNMTKNNCEINPYGHSVFDSPLSLSTLNEDQIASNNNSHLTTLTSATRHQERFNRNHLSLDAKNNVNLNKTSSIPSSTSSTLNSLLNVKSEHTENLLKNNHMTTTKIVTKLPENIPTDSQSLKKSVHHLTNCTLNDYELISLPLRELNKRLRYVPKVTAIDLKKRRRTLKNRKYAQNCRSKRLEQKCEMEHTNTKLKHEINCLKKLIEKYQHDLQVYKTYVEDLAKDPTKISTINLKPKFNVSNNESSLVMNNNINNEQNSNNNQIIDELRPNNRS